VTKALLLGLLVLCFQQSSSQFSGFSQENATAILKTLVLDIGRRPMGSPAEQRAMQFAIEKFREYGCDTSYVLPMTVASNVNTKSGVAVGVKKGRTSRIIVIGGHIDSVPDAPGANDDGSGTACVIELARVLNQRENESTIYFCCWGGEEQGLEGSTFFVEHFKDIDSVALMFQIDMADGASTLNADPDGSKSSAPFWLVRSAFEIFYDELPHQGLIYPTEDATWNLASGGSWGSDHIPFIDKGIPAIDFTSDPTFPIHTPQDNWENFTPLGLKRTGDLVLKLFEKYDGGVPSRTTERYQLVQIGKSVFAIPYFVLWLFIGISITFLVVAFIVARQRRLVIDPTTKVKWSRFKLILAALVIQTFVWTSESLIGFLKGYRFPWANNIFGFKLLGFLFGLVGLWFVLQAVRKYRLSPDAFVFARLSLIPFLILTILASYITPELGVFLAASSLAFAVAIIGRKPMFKLTFFLFSFLIFYHLIFFDGVVLFQRIIATNGMNKFWQNALADVGFILVFTGLSLPFVHGFTAVYRGSGVDLFWLKKFGERSGLIAVVFGVVCVSGYLLTQPVYDRLWYNSMRVEQLYTLGADSSAVTVKGSEYVNGLIGRLAGRDTVFSDNTNFLPIDSPKAETISWLNVTHEPAPRTKISDSTWKVDRVVAVRTEFRPLRLDVTYESTLPFEITSSWASGPKSPDPSLKETDKRKRFRWAYFPDTSIVIPVSFTLRDSQQVTERVEVVFDSVAYPIRLQREYTNISYRTTITAHDSFSVVK
jgi:hypothetical protein